MTVDTSESKVCWKCRRIGPIVLSLLRKLFKISCKLKPAVRSLPALSVLPPPPLLAHHLSLIIFLPYPTSFVHLPCLFLLLCAVAASLFT